MEIKVSKDNYQIVPIDQVKPNTWNPKDKNTEEYRNVVKILRKRGQTRAVLVRELGDEYEILDGEQRWTGMKELGFDQILINNLGEVSDKEAMEITAWFQEQAPFQTVPLAQLVREIVLAREGDVSLPYSDNQIDEFLRISAPFEFNYNDDFERPDREGTKRISIRVTKSQYDFITETLEAVKEDIDSQNKLKEGDILVFVCDKVMEVMK